MNMQSFDQFELSKDDIGDAAVFLKENMIVNVSSYEGKIIGVVLPDTIIAEVVEAEPVVKGQTATGSYKPAVLDNGVRIMVPPHIDVGMKIVVNTGTGEYVERAK